MLRKNFNERTIKITQKEGGNDERRRTEERKEGKKGVKVHGLENSIFVNFSYVNSPQIYFCNTILIKTC